MPTCKIFFVGCAFAVCFASDLHAQQVDGCDTAVLVSEKLSAVIDVAGRREWSERREHSVLQSERAKVGADDHTQVIEMKPVA